MKPILFSTPMVQAILDGSKTMTRRVCKPVIEHDVVRIDVMKNGDWYFKKYLGYRPCSGHDISGTICRPPYKLGDVLWVRETWTCIRNIDNGHEDYFYAANKLDYDTVSTTYLCDDEGFETGRPFPWKPSIHMPKKLARLFLRVTDVRAERVQDITEADSIAEGIEWFEKSKMATCFVKGINQGNTAIGSTAVEVYKCLWDSLNVKRGYGWDKNPWVWVYTFERISKEEADKCTKQRSTGRTAPGIR
jgi:hypothetical protein